MIIDSGRWTNGWWVLSLSPGMSWAYVNRKEGQGVVAGEKTVTPFAPPQRVSTLLLPGGGQGDRGERRAREEAESLGDAKDAGEAEGWGE